MSVAQTLRAAAVVAGSTSAGWRTSVQPRFRGWHALALGGAVTGSFAGAALQLPLLLLLGLDPGLAWLVALVPSIGAAAQPLFPWLLALVDGRLRALTIVAFAIAESRSLVVAALVGLHAAGLVPAAVPLVGIAAIGAVSGISGQFAATGQRIWTWVVLTEGDRRLVAPRIGTMGAAAGAGLLWLASAALGAGTATGLWIYAACFAVGGSGSLLGLRGLLVLPRPGSVRSPTRRATPVETSAAFRNLLGSSVLAATGAGLQPAIPLVALAVVHLPAAFTVTLGALGSTIVLLASLAGSSFIAARSASRLLRATHVARFGELILVMLAVQRPEIGPALLVAAALLEAGTSSVNGIASSETLYRLSGPAIVAYQGRFSAVTQTAFTLSAFVAATVVTANPGPFTFLVLLAASAAVRVEAARRLRVSPSWRELPAATARSHPGLGGLAASSAPGR
jgi:hypothetical protein